jgi:hypothetical protein
MYKKITGLSFVIGAFFSVTSLILFGNILINERHDTVSIISAATFLVFGLAMMLGSGRSES